MFGIFRIKLNRVLDTARFQNRKERLKLEKHPEIVNDEHLSQIEYRINRGPVKLR